MTAYEIFLIIVFGVLTIVSVWSGIKTYRRTASVKDPALRKAARQKSLLLAALGLIFLLCALYIIFRAGWLFFIVFLVGCMAVAYAVGSGIGENMKKH